MRVTDAFALLGFIIYALAAPHSIAISWAGISILILAWLIRLLTTRKFGLRRTPFDLPLLLFAGWTVLSCALSIEPRESLPKLVNVSTFLMFYLTQSLLTRKTAIVVAGVMILSATAGVLWGAGELVIGRGVIVKTLSADSPLRSATPLREGDVIWRVNGRRVSSVSEIDDDIKQTRAGDRLRVSVISNGEHVEWPAMIVTEEMRHTANPSGMTGGGRTHSFRASGWTRHYQTFAEVLQIVAQFALGFALASFANVRLRSTAGGLSRYVLPAGLAFMVLAIGIALTAMRTTLVAFAVGALVNAWRATSGRRSRLILVGIVGLIVVAGALVIWRTRASGALELRDPSASLRLQVAGIAARRVFLHPIFGHGMDAMHEHWQEWGFPGSDMLDAHSTPIQIAFDRGLPTLGLWVWLMFSFWGFTARTERMMRPANDWAARGLTLGVLAALTGFLISSLVNYNFGDSEVALLLWWMMACVVVLRTDVAKRNEPARLAPASVVT